MLQIALDHLLSTGLVELHHGSIKFSSIQGKGTIFHILIPVNKEEYSADEIEQDRVFVAPDESNINSWLDPESVQEVLDVPDRKERDPDMPKILIIEDNQDILAYLKDSLYESF